MSGRHDLASYTTRDVEIALGTQLEDVGATIDLDHPEQTLHVLLADQLAYLGVAATAPAAWAARNPAPVRICRAEAKIAQALAAFGLGWSPGTAVADLGASPGGWTLTLAGAGLRVTAVDPAGLHPLAAEHPNVTHWRQRAETVDWSECRFDLVVNDMGLDPDESAKIMADAGIAVAPGVDALMTVKLPTLRVERWEQATRRMLESRWEVLGVRHLPSNRQEFTLHLRRR